MLRCYKKAGLTAASHVLFSQHIIHHQNNAQHSVSLPTFPSPSFAVFPIDAGPLLPPPAALACLPFPLTAHHPIMDPAATAATAAQVPPALRTKSKAYQTTIAAEAGPYSSSSLPVPVVQPFVA